MSPVREFKVDKKYLNLPVKNGTARHGVSLLVGGQVEREFEIELAEGDADWWAFIDISGFKGRAVTVQADGLPEDSAALKAVEQSDSIKGVETLYREALRPQFHFTARRGWNNDPNGLVYYRGEYHLFFQHNPYGWNWGNMHWGHAVSPDMVHWTELDDAIRPDALGTIFSGSAVVDETNTAGFARGNERAIVCIYTAAGGTNRMSTGVPFSQCIAFSTDRGRTWNKYDKNPVLPHIVASNRDPKVIWYAKTRKWVMALYLDGNDYALFESPDLKTWRRICDVKLEGDSECPEFFELPVAGRAGDARWVFYGGKGLYLIGLFDGTKFTPESGPHQLNFGNCFYASQTFNGVPDSRRILVPWGQVAMPGMPFNQMMGFPVELSLRPAEEGLRLFAMPVREVQILRTKKHSWKDVMLKPGENLLAGVKGELFDVTAELAPGRDEAGFAIRGTTVGYDVDKEELFCGDKRAKLRAKDGKIRLRLLVDRVSIDIFANDGRVYMPMQFQPKADRPALEMYCKGGGTRVVSLEVNEMRSAWGK